MKGILLYNTPNKHTGPPTCGGQYAVTFAMNFVGVSEDERYIVGTHCGATPYNQQRVDEYMRWRAAAGRWDGSMMRHFFGDVVVCV